MYPVTVTKTEVMVMWSSEGLIAFPQAVVLMIVVMQVREGCACAMRGAVTRYAVAANTQR